MTSGANSLTVFDHRDPGTSESLWGADGRIAAANVLPVPGNGRRMVVVAAHPDDETLGAGGLIAMAARNRARIDVIVATDGEASHPASPTHTRAQLAVRRRAEVVAAVVSLDWAASVIQLGLPDGLLDQNQDALEQVIDLALAPGSLLVTPWQGDRHPDHEACARAAEAVLASRPDVEHWQYPIWAWHWANPDSAPWSWENVCRIDLDAAANCAKQTAISVHASQNEPLSDLGGDEAILTESFLAHFQRPYETFLVESSEVKPAVAADRATGVPA
jgi:LmbE family N-acetylglucosaminyl deacetylase